MRFQQLSIKQNQPILFFKHIANTWIIVARNGDKVTVYAEEKHFYTFHANYQDNIVFQWKDDLFLVTKPKSKTSRAINVHTGKMHAQPYDETIPARDCLLAQTDSGPHPGLNCHSTDDMVLFLPAFVPMLVFNKLYKKENYGPGHILVSNRHTTRIIQVPGVMQMNHPRFSEDKLQAAALAVFPNLKSLVTLVTLDLDFL